MDFLGRSWSSQEPNHLHGVMSVFIGFFFCNLLYVHLFSNPHVWWVVSQHVRVCLIIVLLFLCPNFIPLPCHRVMCCIFRCYDLFRFLRTMDESAFVTNVCSFNKNIALVCLCCLDACADIFLGYCPTGRASLAASLFFLVFVTILFLNDTQQCCIMVVFINSTRMEYSPCLVCMQVCMCIYTYFFKCFFCWM